MSVEAIIGILTKNGIAVEQAEVEQKFAQMVSVLRVDEKTAGNAIMNEYAKKAGKTLVFDSNKVKATVIETNDLNDGSWIQTKLKIMKLFENNHPKIVQKGVAGDETGSITFTVWDSANVPTLVEGQTYNFDNVVSNKYMGAPQLSVNKNSAIVESDVPIEAVPETKTIVGAVTGIMASSGLIKRCPECEKALIKGACQEHGKVNGNYDIRLMMVIDDGKRTYNVNANRKLTEEVMKMTLDNATSLAADALDSAVVREKQIELFEGRYMEVEVLDMQSKYLNCCRITPIGME